MDRRETVEVFRRNRVRTQWNPPGGAWGGHTPDAEDDAVSLVVRGLGEAEIASESFALWARTIWSPLQAHEHKWKGDAP